jgi:hypothetical protein
LCFALGGQHKLAGLTGAAYKFTTAKFFTRATGTEPVVAIADGKFGLAGPELDDALLRYGLGRLVSELSAPAGVETLFGPNAEGITWTIDATHLDDIASPAAMAKRCAYQLTAERDTYCAAATPKDEASVGSIGHRFVAPTSRPICGGCGLPDDRR